MLIQLGSIVLTLINLSPLIIRTCLYCSNYAPLRWREGILLCTCRSVGRLVGPSVTFLILINNSRMLWPTFLYLCPHIRPWQQRNPIDFGVTMCQNCFRLFKLQFPKMNFFIHLWHILNWLIKFYNTSATKKSLGGIMFYNHLLLFYVLSTKVFFAFKFGFNFAC